MRTRSGQSTVEYMLYISVLVIGVLAAAYVLIGPLSNGMDGLRSDAETVLPENLKQGTNDMR